MIFDKTNSTTMPRLQLNTAKKALLCVMVLGLTACASNQNKPTDHKYLLANAKYAQTDPLGAWLAEENSTEINYPNSANLSSKPKTMASTALKFLGVKYRYGGEGPGQGFDCSGLVAYAAEKSLGLKLPRTASAQAQQGKAINKAELQRGDLVFFNTMGRKFSHVGIYLGDHKFVHSPRTGAKIRIESMNVAYWKNRYNGARRIDPQSITASR